MASVTFIIGNGLDLSFGLKTSYRDFYDFVNKQGLHPENRIYKAIQESPEDWSEFELALGRYTRYIEELPEKNQKAESLKLHDELDELRDDLAAYLDSQENSIENLPDKFKFSANGFFADLPVGQKNRIISYLSQGATNVRFISLNYTKTLERILLNSPFLKAQGMRIHPTLHIHGDLTENLTLGLSDETQLSSSLIGLEKEDLIKQSLISSMNDGRIEELKQTIATSTIIVFYGTSIGESDRYIWEMVLSWLSDSPDAHAIIHKYDETFSDSVKRSSRKQKQYISNVQDRLLRHSKLDGDAMAELKNQIFVIHNTKKLFTASN